MVFNGMSIELLIIIILGIWVCILTFFVYQMTAHYNKLTGKGERAGLREILDGLMDSQKGLRSQQKTLENLHDDLKKEGKLHIQRVGLVRFNPFSDTGGSQSFTMALLDGHNNGLVMTSLYARNGHRWYVKEVVGAKGKELALSKEEQAAIGQAKPFANT